MNCIGLKSITDARGFSISYAYDGVGNLTELTYPGNKKVIFTYTAWNSLQTVQNWLGQTATYYYDDAGRCTGYTHFNGTETYYSLDAANRLTDIDIMSDQSMWVAWYSYALDSNGNRTNVTSGVPIPEPSPVTGAESYGYNVARNLLLSSGMSNFTYDLEGQLSTGYGASYTFDFEHRLTGIGSTAAFTYNGRGNRLQAVRGTETTRYIHDASGNLLAETNAENQVRRYYIYGVGLLGMITTSDNEIYCYHFDGTGNTIALTDSLKRTVSGYAYDTFGTIVDQTEWLPQPFKFAGQFGVMAEPSGLYYMRARYYDPLVGRFISEDPTGFSGGDVNLYAYARNSAANFVDANGKIAFNAGAALVGAGIGVAVGTVSAIYNGGDVWQSALLGAATGATAGFTFGASLAVNAVAGASIGVGANLAGQMYSNVTSGISALERVDTLSIFISGASGAIGASGATLALRGGAAAADAALVGSSVAGGAALLWESMSSPISHETSTYNLSLGGK